MIFARPSVDIQIDGKDVQVVRKTEESGKDGDNV